MNGYFFYANIKLQSNRKGTLAMSDETAGIIAPPEDPLHVLDTDLSATEAACAAVALDGIRLGQDNPLGNAGNVKKVAIWLTKSAAAIISLGDKAVQPSDVLADAIRESLERTGIEVENEARKISSTAAVMSRLLLRAATEPVRDLRKGELELARDFCVQLSGSLSIRERRIRPEYMFKR